MNTLETDFKMVLCSNSTSSAADVESSQDILTSVCTHTDAPIHPVTGLFTMKRGNYD